jgi:uncharacterized protein
MRWRRLKTALAVFAAGGVAHAASVGVDREVTIDGGLARLHGSLRTAEHPTTGAAMLMLMGSGQSDRNANGPPSLHTDGSRMIADELAARGITTLRIDKRCVGASAPACPREEDLRVQTYVDDAVAWVRFLRAQPGVSCVVVYGHSEGAMFAALVAAETPVCGVVSASGPGRPFDEVIQAQMTARGAPTAVVAETDRIMGELKQGRLVADVPPTPRLQALFRPSIQPYMISEFAISPSKAIAAVKAPVLVLQGGRDLNVSVEDALLLVAARPGAKLVLLPEMNHVLKDVPADRAANNAAYRDPSLPLDPGVAPALAAFVINAGRSGGR